MYKVQGVKIIYYSYKISIYVITHKYYVVITETLKCCFNKPGPFKYTEKSENLKFFVKMKLFCN